MDDISREEKLVKRENALDTHLQSIFTELREEEVFLNAAAEESTRLTIKTVISLNAGLLITLAALLSDPDREVEMNANLLASCITALLAIAVAVIALDFRSNALESRGLWVRKDRNALQLHQLRPDPWEPLPVLAKMNRMDIWVHRLTSAGPTVSGTLFIVAAVQFLLAILE